MSESDQPSKWPPDLLYEHLMKVMDERHAQYAERFRASQEAIEKANLATQIRFESVNEWRVLVQGIIDTLAKSEEMRAQYRQLNDKIEQNKENLHSRSAAIEHMLNQQIDSIDQQIAVINQQLSENRGTRAGLSTSWGILLAVVGIIGGSVFAIINLLAK